MLHKANTTNPCRQAALDYASNEQRSLYGFPAKPGEKKSRVAKRYSADGANWGMTNNPSTIEYYFDKWPDSNWCLVTGEISGIFALDTDGAAHGKDGETVLKKVYADHNEEWPPKTLTQITPSGGRHYVYAYPDGDIIIPNSTGKLGSLLTPGVDVRGEGGMICASPSYMPKYDAYYEWEKPKQNIVKAPDWLIKLVAEKPPQKNLGEPQADIAKLAAAMELIPNEKPEMSFDVTDYKTGEVTTRTGWEGWNTISMCLFRATAGSDEGYAVFRNWCAKNKHKFNEKYTYYTWDRRYRRSPPKSVGAGTLFAIAETEQPGWQKIYDHEHVEQIIEAKIEEAKANKTKYRIKLKAGTNNNLRELEAFLIDAKVPLYVFGKTLVRPITSDVEAMQGKMTKVAELYDVEPQYLKVIAQEHIWFEKWQARKWNIVKPPMDLINDLMAMVGDWKFPVIKGIISTPTLLHDGSILSQPGYDPKTRLLMIEPPELPPMPEKSSKADAVEAIKLLEELLSEFAFVNAVAKSVALAALITPVVKGACNRVPMFVNKAPTPASGKSYLFDIVAAIAIGQRMPVIAAGRTEEETEKRLGAVLIAGRPLISIDNVDGELGGEALCQILERPSVDIRVLGKSETRTIDPRGTVMFATGNNIALVGAITRRALTCTLDKNMEQPEQYEYKNNPVEMVLADRGKYIAACLTVCRAYIQAGKPGKAKRLGSYEGWSDVVRSALIWLGGEDPVTSMDTARDEDPKLIELEEILTEWARVIGTGEVSAMSLNKVIELCQQDGDNGYDRFVKKYQDFYDAVCRVASSYGRPPDLKRFSSWASHVKGRLLNGKKLVNAPGHGGVAKWWVQHGDDPKKDSPGMRHADKVVNVNFNEYDTNEAVRKAKAALDDALRKHNAAVNKANHKTH